MNLLLHDTSECWPFEKHLPGETSPYETLPKGGWITGEEAVQRGIDLRLFYVEPKDGGWGAIRGAVRFGEGSSIGAGFQLPAHGGAVSHVHHILVVSISYHISLTVFQYCVQLRCR